MENEIKDIRESVLFDDNGNIIGSLDLISFVDSPAMQTNFQMFSKLEKVEHNFKIIDEEKMEICGAAMTPNKLIERRDKNTNEIYLTFFSEKTIEQCAEYFMQFGNTKQTNINHLKDYTLSDVYVKENWIVKDPKTDKSATLGFKDVVEGTWFTTFKITNKELWKELKKTNLSGFSIEGWFGEKKLKQIHLQHIEEDLNEILDDLYLSKEEKLSAIKETVKFYELINVGELSFNNYPKAARENAKRALKYKEENNIDCGTLVGWQRANQLAKGENISFTTVKRMAAFVRHEQNSKVPYNEGCGGIMWDAWGGDEGINWAIRIVVQIEKLIEEQNS